MNYRVISLFSIVFIIILACLIWGGYGILGSVLLVFFTAPVWSSVYMDTRPLSKAQFKADVISLLTEGFWRIVVLVLINIAVAFTIGRMTMIPDAPLLYFVIGFIGYCYAYFKNKRKNLYWFSLGVFPAVFSVFLILNYVVSFNPIYERYTFKRFTAAQLSIIEDDTFIIGYRIVLDNEAYIDYSGIRSFIDESEIKGNTIIYTFERGLFGIRVVKDREFTQVRKAH